MSLGEGGRLESRDGLVERAQACSRERHGLPTGAGGEAGDEASPGCPGEPEDGRVLGITEEGTFFIRRLRLNRTQLVAYRRGLRARQKLREELAAALELVHALEHRMNALDASIDAATDDLERG